MKFKRSSYLIIIALIILIFPLPSKSEKLKDDFLFLGNENIAPLIYKEKNRTKGLLVDIIKELSKTIDHNIEVQAMDWEEAQKKVLLGKGDAILQINRNEEREKLYDFSTELLKSEFSIFVKSDNIDINDIDDLKNKKVGVEVVGYSFYLLEKHKDIDLVVVSNVTSGFKMMEEGILDAVVVDRWIGEHALSKNKITSIKVVEDPIDTRCSYIGVAKGNTELLGLINKGLEEMKMDGRMEKILNNWKGENVFWYTENQMRRNIICFLASVFILIISMSLFMLNKLNKTNKSLEKQVRERTKELYEINEELKILSTTDGLTNLYNRRYFDSEFEKMWKISSREKKALSLILLDVDYFKECNDIYGHLAGDSYLKAIANILKSTVRRPGDIVARYGGEEFIIILYNTS